MIILRQDFQREYLIGDLITSIDTIEIIIFSISILIFIMIFPIVLALWVLFVVISFIRYILLSKKKDAKMLQSFYREIRFINVDDEWWKLPTP